MRAYPRTASCEPAAHRHAAGLLRQHGLQVYDVVRVEADCILYLAGPRHPMTAWLSLAGARWQIASEPGFPAWPDPGLICEPTYEAEDE